MRPLRKSAIWDAFQEQYGKATAGGQLLAYFSLICILAVLAMVLAGQVLVDIAPPSYAGAAGLIPLTALGFVGPALYRTVNQNVNVAQQAAAVHRRGDRGGAPVHRRHLGAGADDRRLRGADRDDRRLRRCRRLFLFVRGQRGKQAAELPLPRGAARRCCSRRRSPASRSCCRSSTRGSSWSSPSRCCLLWIVLLVPLRAIPPEHWEAAGPHDPLVPARDAGGLPAPARACAPRPREPRRAARWRWSGGCRASGSCPRRATRALRLVGALRQVGQPRAGSRSAATRPARRRDGRVPVRGRLDRGPQREHAQAARRGRRANDLRSIEDLVSALARVPVEAWEDARMKRRGHRGRRRRAAAELRARARLGTRRRQIRNPLA